MAAGIDRYFIKALEPGAPQGIYEMNFFNLISPERNPQGPIFFVDRKNVYDITAHPTNPEVAWAAMGEGPDSGGTFIAGGIWKTRDGGATWVESNSGLSIVSNPTAGNTGITSNAKTAPVIAVNETARVVFGALSQAVHSASHNDEAVPQSASIDTSNVHWSSMCLYALPSSV